MLLRTVEENHPPGSNVLKVGVGTGFISMYLSLKGCDVTGIDIDEQILSWARHNARQLGAPAKFVCLDMFRIGTEFPRYAFDCIVHHGTLEHFADSEIVEALRGQLHAGKQVVFSVPSSNVPRKRRKAYFGDERFMPYRKWAHFITTAGGRVGGRFGFGFSRLRLRPV